MKLSEVNQNEKDAYNHFVATNDSGSFLQSWEWGEWQGALGREVRRYFIGKDDNNNYNDNILGSIQLIKMPLPFGKFYLYAPYGPVVGKSDESEAGSHIVNAIKTEFPEAVFIRLEPKADIGFKIGDLRFKKTTNIQPGKTLTIDLAKTEEQLLAEMHPKTRYNIRLAQKHNVEIKDEFALTIGKGLYAKEAVDLIYATAKRQDYVSQNRAYFENLINFFAIQNPTADLKLHIYKALYKNELLSSAIMLDFGATRTYLFGGSSDENKNVMAPYFLHFQAMLDAKQQGLKYYDFWGVETAGGQTPGFVRFKLGFAPQLRSGSSTPQLRSGSSSGIKEYGGASDAVNKPFLYRLYSFMRWLNRLQKQFKI